MQELVMTSANASTELRAVLGQIVDIHERQLEIVTRKFTTDQVGYTDVINTKIELGKAKIRQAQTVANLTRLSMSFAAL